MLEKEIEEALRVGVAGLGGFAYKWASPGNAGVPDRIVVLPWGEVYFVELKQARGVLTKLQTAQQNKLRHVGANVVTLYGLTDVYRFLRLLASEMEAREIVRAFRKPAKEGGRHGI